MTHMPELLALARLPNVAVKATGVPGYSAEAYPFPAMQDYVRQVFDAFGPDRMFWGSDISKMPCPWRQCVTTFTEELPWLRGRRSGAGDGTCGAGVVGVGVTGRSLFTPWARPIQRALLGGLHEETQSGCLRWPRRSAPTGGAGSSR